MRVSCPVLRGAEGEVPSVYSPAYQTYLQSLLGIGDVSFTTHYNNGMYLCDLKEYQEIYDFLIEKSKQNTFPRRRI